MASSATVTVMTWRDNTAAAILTLAPLSKKCLNLGAGGHRHHVPSGIGVADASKVGGADVACWRQRVTSTTVSELLRLLCRDGKYEALSTPSMVWASAALMLTTGLSPSVLLPGLLVI